MRKLSSSDKMLAYVSYNSDSPTVNGRYVHWEKLRRLPPIPEWTTEERWLLLKRARSTLLKPMPLRSTTNKNFHVALPEEALEQLHLLDRDAGSQILISEDILNRESQRRYVISSLMEEAITSSQIEGAATTRKDAKEMLRTGRLPRDHSERMILNNYRAMQHISSIAKQPLTQEVVFELHRILGDNALDVKDGAGRFRRPDEHIGVYTPENDLLHDPPPADQLPERMKQMCDFANGLTPSTFVHPVVRAIILHFWLAYDHPFADGNGRCARALFYWAMLRSNYWLAEFLSISSVIRKAKVQYGRAFLYVETDDFDLTYFVLYHLEVIRKAIDELRGHLQRKMREVRTTESLLRKTSGFNHRQLALLSHALRHPEAEYTIESHRNSHDVVYETARKDLLDLADRGLLSKRERGKSFVFHVSPTLADKLSDGTPSNL
jgi:Fic family protein